MMLKDKIDEIDGMSQSHWENLRELGERYSCIPALFAEMLKTSSDITYQSANIDPAAPDALSKLAKQQGAAAVLNSFVNSALASMEARSNEVDDVVEAETKSQNAPTPRKRPTSEPKSKVQPKRATKRRSTKR